jgi:hypothetical protein
VAQCLDTPPPPTANQNNPRKKGKQSSQKEDEDDGDGTPIDERKKEDDDDGEDTPIDERKPAAIQKKGSVMEGGGLVMTTISIASGQTRIMIMTAILTMPICQSWMYLTMKCRPYIFLVADVIRGGRECQ